jgi:hypothetical protein
MNSSSRPTLICLAVCVAALGIGQVFRRPVILGMLSGVAFGSSAVAGRILVSSSPGQIQQGVDVLSIALLLFGVAAGEVLLTQAFARHAVAGPTAAMYITATAWPALVETLWLTHTPPAVNLYVPVAGTVLALAGMTRLTRLVLRET